MPLSLIILLGILLLMMIRKPIHPGIPIWAIMLIGAILMLILKQISFQNGLHSININIILYLWGAFILCQAAETSGYLAHLTHYFFTMAHTGQQVLRKVIFILGVSSTFLMNDTIAIVGTLIILNVCQAHKKLIQPLPLALAYSITIKSY